MSEAYLHKIGFYMLEAYKLSFKNKTYERRQVLPDH